MGYKVGFWARAIFTGSNAQKLIFERSVEHEMDLLKNRKKNKSTKIDICQVREKNIAFYEERDKKAIFKTWHSLFCFGIITKGNLANA